MKAEIIKSQQSGIKSILNSLQSHDFTPCYELAVRLRQDPALLAEFAKNPELIAKREVGYEPPPGLHMHYMDERLTLIPPEGSGASQLLSVAPDESWSRIEVRTGVGTFCVFNCGQCNISGGSVI